MINCMVAGVGGQGTVLASKLIGLAAMEKGMQVRTTETIGMAQRGGSVVSHVRMGEIIHSPLVPLGASDIIIAFEPAEAVRLTPYLAGAGTMLVCDMAIKPVTSALSEDGYEAECMVEYLKCHIERLILISGAELMERCKNPKTLNIAMLGAALSCGMLPFDERDMERIIRYNMPARFVEMNLFALQIGRGMYDEQRAVY